MDYPAILPNYFISDALVGYAENYLIADTVVSCYTAMEYLRATESVIENYLTIHMIKTVLCYNNSVVLVIHGWFSFSILKSYTLICIIIFMTGYHHSL